MHMFAFNAYHFFGFKNKKAESIVAYIDNIFTPLFPSLQYPLRMKFIPRWTPLALSPRKCTENTNDVRNSPLFLECCYFKIASTRCKAIPIASPNKFRISQYRLRLILFTSFYSVMYSLIQKRLLKSINRLKRGTTVAKQICFSMMQLFWQILKTFLSLC